MSDDQLAAITVGELERIDGPIHLADPDPSWPMLFDREAERIRGLLRERVLLLEHVGSTAVPGLPAKPRIDLVMAVSDSADEAAYVAPLEAAGYLLRIREPDWLEHRVLKGPDSDINLHVFSEGEEEIDRMIVFRDHLRRNDADRQLYAATKRDLAARTWVYVQNYADAKSEVIAEIMQRATGR
ncbi:MAG: GrpB family protein [Acidimicrobiia bacterium]|nr:GrpB family protein [Acidimicrobiia bacterium]